ncbi:CAP domain-containing protein [bacterium]|nr:CAP domain-containing protein [Akkermansiaceae bacterium]MDB4418730.1 CAP domain-containing protein [bacterium]
MLRIILLLGLISQLATAAPRATDEILSRLQTCIKTETSTDDLIESLEALEGKEVEAILKEYDKTWPKLRDKYLSDYEAEAKEKYSGALKTDHSRMIKSYRADFMRVRNMPEGPMKKEIPKVSKPAIDGLRKILMPKPEELLATSKPSLQKLRTMILVLANFRDALVEAAVLPDQEEAQVMILQSEKDVAEKLGGLDRDGLRIMKKNDDIAAKSKIPAGERECIREVNEWRMLLGQSALVIDPKLCEASRDHSEDMNKLKFFDHMSPVPGKRSPGDRAAKAGTSWSGENIYMGSQSPAAANKGWFYSPGHHKNMFKGGHKKIGVGQYERHWTQMFG